jgi:RimJ/RimL family protein N-acetyltransferase
MNIEDQSDWLEFVTDEESYQFLDYSAPTEEEARAWFQSNKSVRLTDPKGHILLALELQKPAKVIGSVSFYLSDREEHRQGRFQIMIDARYRRQGYGTEGVGGILGLGFKGISLHDIRVGIDSRNVAARRMVEKAGMKSEGEFIEDHFYKGEWLSTAYYRILRADYETKR